jgi:trimethylamine--corrinoid protein Co-methyltransferase
MQTEYLYPAVGDRRSPNEWAEQGSLDVTARAMKKVEEILMSHFPSHIAESVDAEIRRRFPVRLDRAAMRPSGSATATERAASPRTARA